MLTLLDGKTITLTSITGTKLFRNYFAAVTNRRLSCSESSEHIALWCSGNGPWYEVRPRAYDILCAFLISFLHIFP